ncbi:MAG TPA: hypothetical protein VK838_00580 [Candidatus Limnocylindrales bacterium]|nr:hypothetical protein [Candidatus Limnocylindrales bacterium]
MDSGQSAAGLAASFGAPKQAGHALSGGADAYLFEPEQAEFRGQAVYVLCVDGQVLEAGRSRAALLESSIAASAVRLGGSEGSVNGVRSVDPGYVLGRVNRAAIVSLQLAWMAADGSHDEWSAPVSAGLSLIPIPAGIPVDTSLAFRFLDQSGTAVWVEYED